MNPLRLALMEAIVFIASAVMQAAAAAQELIENGGFESGATDDTIDEYVRGSLPRSPARHGRTRPAITRLASSVVDAR
jgi:hypothetical protein